MEVLRELVDSVGLGVLVVQGPDGLDANHIPFEVASDLKQLRGHIARENPLRRMPAPIEALVIFQGPHHYISPAWQPARRSHGRVAPSWNYAVCHLHGELSFVEDGAWLRTHLDALADREEAGRPEPWRVSEAPVGFVDGLLPHIVGIQVDVTRILGKSQACQQYGERARDGVISGLQAEGPDLAAAMAKVIASYRP